MTPEHFSPSLLNHRVTKENKEFRVQCSFIAPPKIQLDLKLNSVFYTHTPYLSQKNSGPILAAIVFQLVRNPHNF